MSLLWTRRGEDELPHFTISSLGENGLLLRCTRAHPYPETEVSWEWPGHVAAPDLLHLLAVVHGHSDTAHPETATEGGTGG